MHLRVNVPPCRSPTVSKTHRRVHVQLCLRVPVRVLACLCSVLCSTLRPIVSMFHFAYVSPCLCFNLCFTPCPILSLSTQYCTLCSILSMIYSVLHPLFVPLCSSLRFVSSIFHPLFRLSIFHLTFYSPSDVPTYLYSPLIDTLNVPPTPLPLCVHHSLFTSAFHPICHLLIPPMFYPKFLLRPCCVPPYVPPNPYSILPMFLPKFHIVYVLLCLFYTLFMFHRVTVPQCLCSAFSSTTLSADDFQLSAFHSYVSLYYCYAPYSTVFLFYPVH